METADLIQSLATNLAPVKRLRSPVMRASLWLVLAAVIVGLLSISQGVRPQFAERMQDASISINMLASVVTGILAAIATFMISLPDRSSLWLLLPAPSLAAWLASIGYQCFTGWVSLPPGAITTESTASCISTLVFTSLPLSLTLLVMLRYAALLRPVATMLIGSLAVSAITSAALSMFHPLDATVMVLIWNLGTAVLLVGVAALVSARNSRNNPGVTW
jgi:hypothetical protein